MPLGDDQKAMLRLLARGQSYEDIAALLGLSVDEVSSRAKGAVEQLEAEGIPAPALPEVPGGTVAPKPPEPKAEKPPEPPPSPTPVSAPPQRGSRGDDRWIPIAAATVGALAAIALVLFLLLGGTDGGDDTTTGSDGTTVAESGNGQPTTAQLEAVDGSDASGTAEFGRVKESLALGIRATGVERLPKGQIYMVWLADTPQKLLPLTAVVANKTGRINASYAVPTEAVVYLASGEFDRLVITRTARAELTASLERANQDKDFPTYTGDPVLEGEVVGPIVGAAKRLEERQK